MADDLTDLITGTVVQPYISPRVMVAPGPTNPPPPPDPTPPPVPVLDVAQTTWGSPRPSSFGIREVPGVPLWVSQPHVEHVTTTTQQGAPEQFHEGRLHLPRTLEDWADFDARMRNPALASSHDWARDIYWGFSSDPDYTTPAIPQIIISTDVVTMDFAVGFGTQTRPADQRVNSNLLKLYADGMLIYTSGEGFTGALAGLKVRWHPGFADAMPDPAMQAQTGDFCPAHRDEMYCVIEGYPMQANKTKLPVVRALISDVDAQPTPDAAAYAVGATHIVDGGNFVDFSTGTFYGFDSVTSAPHSIYAYDMVTQAEIGHSTMDLTSPQISFWVVYDKDNGLIVFQHGGGISNSLPIAAARVQDGHVLDSFGVESDSLSSSVAGLATSFFGELMKYRAFGLTCYGIMAAGIFTEVKYAGYTHELVDLPVAAGMPNVKIDRGGLVQGNDLTLRFDGAFNTPTNVSCMCSYPVLERPELAQAFDVNNQLFQAHVGLVAYDTKLAVVTSGLQVFAGYSVEPVIGFKIFSNDVVYDVGVGTIAEMFVNPTDGDLMCVVVEIPSVLVTLTKLHPIWARNDNGMTIAGFQTIYAHRPLPGYNVSGMRTAVKASVLDSGRFGFRGNGGHFVVLDMATGATVYDQFLSVDIGNGWSFNGTTGTIEASRVLSSKVTHINLFGPDTGGEVLLTVLLNWLALALGYEQSAISFEGIPDLVIGGRMMQPQSVRQLLSVLSEVYDFDQVENGGTIKFVRVARNEAASVALLAEKELSPLQEFASGGSPISFGQGSTPDVNNLLATVAAPDEVPADVSITYIDPDAGYIDNTQIYRRVRFPFETVKTQRTQNYQLPIVMTATDALSKAGRLTFATFGNSITFDFRLPHKYLDLEPSDVVTVLDRDNKANLVKITQMTKNDDWSFTCNGINWSFSDSITLTADQPLGHRDPRFHGPSETLMFAFDVPLIVPTDEVPNVIQVYTTVGNLNGVSFWEGARVSRQLEGGTMVPLYRTHRDTSFGVTDVALPTTNALGTTFQTDNSTVLTVTGRSFDAAALASADSEDFFRAGQRKAIMGRQGRWELVYYRTVTPVDTHTAQISGLMRGRRGTEAVCDTHQVGDLFIPVDLLNWNRDFLAGGDIGKQDTYFAAGANVTTAPRTDTISPLTGATNKPWAPVQMKMRLGSTVNAVGSPSYSNEMGGGGFGFESHVNRRTGCIVTGTNISPFAGENDPAALVDGSETSVVHWATGGSLSKFTFDFRPYGFPQRITEFQFVVSFTFDAGSWVFEGSNDGLSWITLEAATPLLTSSVATHTFTNPDAYWFYQMRQTSGTVSGGPHLREIYFKTMANVQPNDLIISWIRRDRLGQEWVTDPQPLSEADESYEIDILDSLGNVVRTVPRSFTGTESRNLIYLATDQATDGFTPPLANLHLKVYQLSALVGRGFPGDAIIYSA